MFSFSLDSTLPAIRSSDFSHSLQVLGQLLSQPSLSLWPPRAAERGRNGRSLVFRALIRLLLQVSVFIVFNPCPVLIKT